MSRVLMVVGLLAFPAIGQAQIELEARGGLAVGSHSSTYAGLDLLPRPSAELFGKLNWNRYSLIAGGSFAMFGCEQGFCQGPSTVRVTLGSVLAGLEVRYWRAWLRGAAGRGLTDIRGERKPGNATLLSTGLRIDIGHFALTPGLTYRWMSGKTETLALSADLGLAYRIGGRR